MKFSRIVDEIKSRWDVEGSSLDCITILLDVPELLADDRTRALDIADVSSRTLVNFNLQINYIDLFGYIKSVDNVKEKLLPLVSLVEVINRDCSNITLSLSGDIDLHFLDIEVRKIKNVADKYVEVVSLLLNTNIINLDIAINILNQIDKAYLANPGLYYPELSPLITVMKDWGNLSSIKRMVRDVYTCSSNRSFVLLYIQSLNNKGIIEEDFEVILSKCANFPIYLCDYLDPDREMWLASEYPGSIDIQFHVYQDVNFARAVPVVLTSIKKRRERDIPCEIEDKFIVSLNKYEILELLSFCDNKEMLLQVLRCLQSLPFHQAGRDDKLELLTHIFATYDFIKQEHLGLVYRVAQSLLIDLSSINKRVLDYKLEKIKLALKAGEIVIFSMPEDISLFNMRRGGWEELSSLIMLDNFHVEISTLDSKNWSFLTRTNSALLRVAKMLLFKAISGGKDLGVLNEGNIVYDAHLSEDIIKYITSEVDDISSVNKVVQVSFIATMLKQCSYSEFAIALVRDFIYKFNFLIPQKELRAFGLPYEVQEEIYSLGLRCLADALKSRDIVNVPEDIEGLPFDDAQAILSEITSSNWNFSLSAWRHYTNYNDNEIIRLYLFSGVGDITEKISRLFNEDDKGGEYNILDKQDIFLQVLLFARESQKIKHDLKTLFMQRKLYRLWGLDILQLKMFLQCSLNVYGLRFRECELIRIALDLQLEEEIISWYKTEISSWSINKTMSLLHASEIVRVPEDMENIEIGVVFHILSCSDKVMFNFDYLAWQSHVRSDSVLCDLCISFIQEKIKQGTDHELKDIIGFGKVFSTYSSILKLISNINSSYITAQAVHWAIEPVNLLSWGQIINILEAAWANSKYFPFYLQNDRSNPCIELMYVHEKIMQILYSTSLSCPDSFLGMTDNDVYRFLSNNRDHINLIIDVSSRYWAHCSVTSEVFTEYKRRASTEIARNYADAILNAYDKAMFTYDIEVDVHSGGESTEKLQMRMRHSR